MNEKNVRECLKSFSFKRLFIEELGWDRHAHCLRIKVGEIETTLEAVAQKRGLTVYICSPLPDGSIPDYAVRARIEKEVARHAHEHLLIFTDQAKSSQVWQWVRREPGKPIARRENRYHVNQTGEALIQRLRTVEFTLQEEDELGIVDVTSRVRAAFDVEKVTKKFYDLFKKEHDAFLKGLSGITDDEMERWYVSVMLNRLMFIYFIQRKGFLNGDIHYLRTKLDESGERGKDLYYRDFLCPLFFEGFAKQPSDRSAGINKLLGRVPYLNGGLFLKHQIEELYGQKIVIADAVFRRLFDFFDRYQWHLDERPLRKDNEINPDVLGYIFEKYINQKQMGAYYTKEDITGYISRNTIIPFLLDAAAKGCKAEFEPGGPVWRLLADDPDRYIYEPVRKGVDIPLPDYIEAGIKDVAKRTRWNEPAGPDHALPTEIWREHVARRVRCLELREKLANGEVCAVNDLITYNLDIEQFVQDVIANAESPQFVWEFFKAVRAVTVLDPTCGSGAFLFAALNILESIYEALLERIRQLLSERADFAKAHPNLAKEFKLVLEEADRHPSPKYFVYKSITVNNLYGVDIMEEAVEICKLRLFLKLVAQVEDADKIEPLPDIDFNIRAGNTLVGFASLQALENAADMVGKLGIPAIKEKAEIADKAFRMFREMQTKRGMDAKEFANAKQELNRRLGDLRGELNLYLAKEYGKDPKNKAEYEAWLKSHQPFHWFAEFYGIIASGGFDVIIGNPPYVEYSKVKKDYQLKSYSTESCGNLYAFVWERCLAVSTHNGTVGMIQPVAAVCTDGYEPLQKALRQSGLSIVSNFNDRPSKLFDGLEHIRLCIIIQRKSESNSAYSSTYNKWQTTERIHLFHNLSFADISSYIISGAIAKIGTEKESSILKKLHREQGPLADYVRQGIHEIYYTRKLSHFVQILDFIPSMKDAKGHNRKPSELKEIQFSRKEHRDVFLCILNSSLFYWLLTVYSDCRNLNKRDIYFVRFNYREASESTILQLQRLAHDLMQDIRVNSRVLSMKYKEFGELQIQCTYPKLSKPIIDEIDRVLAKHYGFTDEELDFIINYDIKYRMGLGKGNGSGEAEDETDEE